MRSARCPECEARIELSNRESGQLLTYPRCGVDLEVLGMNPPELNWANVLNDDRWRGDAKDEPEGPEFGNMRRLRRVARAICSECLTKIRLDPETVEGQSIYCPYCGTGLEVISLDPAVLDRAHDDSEDEDDDEEEAYDWAESEDWEVPRRVRLV